MSALIKYEAARSALAQCRSLDDVKDIRDKAEAMRAYAQMANDRSLEIDAAEIRVRAERRLGEMIAEQKATTGLNAGGRPTETGRPPRPVLPTLADAGITKDLSSRAQKIASLPEVQFETELTAWREKVSAPKSKMVAPTIGVPPKPRKPRPPKAVETPSVAVAGEVLFGGKSLLEAAKEAAGVDTLRVERAKAEPVVNESGETYDDFVAGLNHQNDLLMEQVHALTKGDPEKKDYANWIERAHHAERQLETEQRRNALVARERDDLQRFQTQIVRMTGAKDPEAAKRWIKSMAATQKDKAA